MQALQEMAELRDEITNLKGELSQTLEQNKVLSESIKEQRVIGDELIAVCELAIKSWFSGEVCEAEMQIRLCEAVTNAKEK